MTSQHPLEPVRPRLWRSRSNKVMAGVVGGLAEKFAINPTFARVLWVAFTVFSGMIPGTVVYFLLWLITRQHDMLPPEGHDWYDPAPPAYGRQDRHSPYDR